MAEENSTTSHLSDAMTATEETQGSRESTVASSLSPVDRSYFTLAVILVGVIGTVSNAFILYALVASKQYKKYLLIFNQNTIDLYTCAMLVVTFVVRHTNVVPLNRSLGYWHCTIVLSDVFVKIGMFGSVINLALVTVDRYVKVCTKKKLRRWMIYSGMAFAWIGSIVYNLTAVFPTTVEINGMCLPFTKFNNKFAKSCYFIFNFLAFYVIILFIFTFCYGRILTAIRRQAKVMASHNAPQSSTTRNQSQLKKIQTNVIKTMIIVSAFYAVMFLPNYINMLLYHFLFLTANRLVMIIYFVSLFCQFLYVCINPFIYAIVFDPVKQILARMIPWQRSTE